MQPNRAMTDERFAGLEVGHARLLRMAQAQKPLCVSFRDKPLVSDVWDGLSGPRCRMIVALGCGDDSR